VNLATCPLRLLFAGLALAISAGAPATGPERAADSGGGRVAVPVYVLPVPGYGFYGNCAFAGGCVDAYRTARTYQERREQVRRDREEIATPKPPPDLWDGASGPWGYTRRIPPPTPESEIQPQYRDSGQVLPQYKESGTR
jgi:hypothetical protein